MLFDPLAIRRQFPFFGQEKAKTFLDSAATTQKPTLVLDAVRRFYEEENGTAYRGFHSLAEGATRQWEESRAIVASFIGALAPETVVFTKSATESLNLVARSLGATWKKGDIVVLSLLEHHSNIVPWLQLQAQQGIEIRWIPCDHEGTLDLRVLDDALTTGRTKLVSITAQSNVLGVRPNLADIIRRCHEKNVLVCVDAAQAIAHQTIDVTTLDCDLLVFSGHKLFAPVGIGVLYGKSSILRQMEPFLGGGGMVLDVTTKSYTPADPPLKFEAGTLPIADAVGLAAAIDWLKHFAPEDIAAHEHTLLTRAQERLATVPGLTILGPLDNAKRHGCLSFTISGLHPHDLSELLGERNFCVRSGHLCAKPLHTHLGCTASTRLSVSLYNTLDEIDAFCAAVGEIVTSWNKAL